jgi:hypothetical protein
VLKGNIDRHIRIAVDPHWHKIKQNAQAQPEAEFNLQPQAE